MKHKSYKLLNIYKKNSLKKIQYTEAYITLFYVPHPQNLLLLGKILFLLTL